MTDMWVSEYEFGFALYRLFQTTHDGHFVYVPDIIGEIFNFARPISLVSVSTDGESVPEIYAYPDILASVGNATFTPSAITGIDGQDAVEYLLNWSQYGSLQDRDALWNNVFYSIAATALGPTGSGPGTFAGAGRGRWVYPGATTTLNFANGSTVTLNNFARVLANFNGVSSGDDLYQKYFAVPEEALRPPSPAVSPTISSTASAVPAATTTPAPGFPPPVIRQSNNLNSGYFLEGEGFEDVAVLSVQSFVGTDTAEKEFQSVNQQFIAQAKAAGKTKLIIDVSANGGGTILQGYDLFRQLFPSIQEVGLQRFRAFEATDLVGQEISEEVAGYPRSLDLANETILDVIGSPFNYRSDMTEDATPFPSWPAKFGPHEFNGDDFTSLFRWNLTDPISNILNSGGIVVTGYLNRTNFTQPFARENVVVLTDGYCASTCTIFSQFMRDQADVKYFAIGGRPNPDPMQAVGGVKGTNNIGWTSVYNYVEIALQFGASTATSLSRYLTLPLRRESSGVAANVNLRDGLRPGDATQVPLQFIYEPSDCRLFYTPEMTLDISESWRAVASIAWGNGTCVSGDEAVYRRTMKRSIGRPSGAKKSLPRLRKRAVADIEALMDSMNIATDTTGMQGDGLMLP